MAASLAFVCIMSVSVRGASNQESTPHPETPTELVAHETIITDTEGIQLQIHELKGVGYFGAVFSTNDDSKVIKFMTPGGNMNNHPRAEYDLAVYAAKNLNYEDDLTARVPEVYDFVEGSWSLYDSARKETRTFEFAMIMEAVHDGKTINAIVSLCTKQQRDDIAKNAESALNRLLARMHGLKMGHNDIHEGNVLLELDEDRKLKTLWLLDWGKGWRYENEYVPQNITFAAAQHYQLKSYDIRVGLGRDDGSDYFEEEHERRSR